MTDEKRQLNRNLNRNDPPVGSKPDEAEIQVSTPDGLFWGSTGPASGTVQGDPEQCTEGKMLILSTREMSSGLYHRALCPPLFITQAYIMVPTTLSSIFLCMLPSDSLWLFQGAKIQADSPSVKVQKALTSCLMNNK